MKNIHRSVKRFLKNSIKNSREERRQITQCSRNAAVAAGPLEAVRSGVNTKPIQ